MRPKLAVLAAVPLLDLLLLDRLTGVESLTGLAAGALLQSAILLPFLCRKSPAPQSRAIRLLLGIYCLTAAGFLLYRLAMAFPLLNGVVPKRGVSLLLLILVCGYAAKCGLKTLLRLAPAAAVFFLLAGCILLAGRLGNAQLHRISWQLSMPEPTAMLGFTGAELPALLILSQDGRTARRALLRLTLLKLSAAALLTVLILSAGRMIQTAKLPVFTLAALSQPLQGQRADAVYLFAFVTLCVMAETLFLTLGIHLLRRKELP